jgi:hypothetical protein
MSSETDGRVDGRATGGERNGYEDVDDPVSAGVRGVMTEDGGEAGGTIIGGDGSGAWATGVWTTGVCGWCIGRGPPGVGGKGRPLLVGLRVDEGCWAPWGL